MHTDLSSFLIKRNAAEIARDYPQFKQVLALPWHAKWIGTLAPIFQEYVISIAYAPGATDERFDYPGPRLEIEVLEPQLAARRDPPQPIPHLYRHPSLTKTPRLCLFWPEDREWDEFKSIAEYIIPWTTEWLANYEIWRITGNWSSPEAPHDVGAEPGNPHVALASTESEPMQVRCTPGRTAELLCQTALASFPYFMNNLASEIRHEVNS